MAVAGALSRGVKATTAPDLTSVEKIPSWKPWGRDLGASVYAAVAIRVRLPGPYVTSTQSPLGCSMRRHGGRHQRHTTPRVREQHCTTWMPWCTRRTSRRGWEDNPSRTHLAPLRSGVQSISQCHCGCGCSRVDHRVRALCANIGNVCHNKPFLHPFGFYHPLCSSSANNTAPLTARLRMCAPAREAARQRGQPCLEWGVTCPHRTCWRHWPRPFPGNRIHSGSPGRQSAGEAAPHPVEGWAVPNPPQRSPTPFSRPAASPEGASRALVGEGRVSGVCRPDHAKHSARVRLGDHNLSTHHGGGRTSKVQDGGAVQASGTAGRACTTPCLKRFSSMTVKIPKCPTPVLCAGRSSGGTREGAAADEIQL